MIYPSNFESKLGFDKIKILIQSECLCSLGIQHIEKIHFSIDFAEIKKQIESTDEFRTILNGSEQFPTDHYNDISTSLDTLHIEGTYLEEEVLLKLKSSLETVLACILFFNAGEEKIAYPHLKTLSDGIIVHKEIIKNISHIIDDKGIVKDNASPELANIRRELLGKQRKIESKINHLLKNIIKDGIVSADTSLVLRNGRSVIPVSATNKRKIRGFIHDESATGQTVYIEPAEIFDANNELRELEYAEKREIIKILLRLTDTFRPFLYDIKSCFYFLGVIDFIRAKAKFAISINATKPYLNKVKTIQLHEAIHPLLHLSLKAHNKKVIPLNLHLNAHERILVISGPNAGGKSVCLKTVGLLQYMFQCGLLIPAAENSEMGVFSDIFVDIGDEQSIENDLSTYSSHLRNMQVLLTQASDATLFLIDEFGTGTEPQIGGSIAESILKTLNEKLSFGVVTTHYANLKHFAEKNAGVINGAMLFDTTNMLSLFLLETGKPGSSFALEIAEQIGLPKSVINNAKKIAGIKNINFDQHLQDLEFDKIKLKKQLLEVEEKEHFLDKLIAEYNQLKLRNAQVKENIENSRNQIIEDAKIKANILIENTNKIIENSIRKIRDSKADKEIVASVREEIKQQSEKIKPLNLKKEKQEIKKNETPIQILNSPITIGDRVRIIGQTHIGEVLEIKENSAIVAFANLKSTVKTERLEKVSKSEIKEFKINSASKYQGFANELMQRKVNFNTQLDIRGLRSDEAYKEVLQYMDEAILLGFKEVQILHGKGWGALRKVVRDYLHSLDEVESADDAHIDFGGSGITVVILR